jgi:hypothetical protein
MIPLGFYLQVGEPELRADKAAHLHVLYRSGPRAFSYAHIDPSGKMFGRMVYSDILSKPRLVADAQGAVTVRGGEQTYPKPDRVMTSDELQPPPPPPEKKKKKSWWQFGRKKETAEVSPTNSPTATLTP